MTTVSQLVQTARAASDAIAYAIFNLANKKLDDLTPGVLESTDAATTALIAERDLRSALAAYACAPDIQDDWHPMSTVPRDGTMVDFWTVRNTRIANVRFIKGTQLDDKRFGEGGIWEHLGLDGWRFDTSDTAVLTESQFTHWRHITGPASR